MTIALDGSSGVTFPNGGAYSNATGSLSTNGYQKLPNGLILQWGLSSTISGTTDQTATVTFPIAFPTSVFNVTVGGVVNATGDARLDAQVSITALTTTGCSLGLRNSVNGTAVGGNINWIAIGY